MVRLLNNHFTFERKQTNKFSTINTQLSIYLDIIRVDRQCWFILKPTTSRSRHSRAVHGAREIKPHLHRLTRLTGSNVAFPLNTRPARLDFFEAARLREELYF